MDKIIDIIAVIAVVAVVGAVLIGIFRLVLDNWTYIIFFIGAIFAAYYMYKQS